MVEWDELTEREQKLKSDLLCYSAAVGYNHEGARFLWNRIVTHYGTAMVEYLRAIETPARPCNQQWGEAGHLGRLAEVSRAVDNAMTDITRWAKPLF